MKPIIILFIISIMGTLIFGTLTGTYGLNYKDSKVDCYDSYKNKIIGQECISKQISLNEFGKKTVLISGISLLTYIVILVILSGRIYLE